MNDEIKQKMTDQFNKAVWIISFYKENGGITISDSHFDDEVIVQPGYLFSKELPVYNLKLQFHISEDFIYYIVNGVEVEMKWNKDSFIYLHQDKKIWICTRSYDEI